VGAALRAAGELARSIDDLPALSRLGGERLPRIAAVHEMAELTRRLVFVGYFERHGVTREGLAEHAAALVGRVEELLSELATPAIAAAFVGRLPALREALALDVLAAYDGDPAAKSIEEVVLCYPGVDAVFSHRAAHALHDLGAPLVARIIAELAHSRTGIDIHPGAEIGRSFFIDHGTGVVIGETAKIGDHVRIYQGVTLGAKGIPRDESGRVLRGVKRHPTIGDRVTIYAEAVILGGDTVVGDDCVVNGSVFVTQSVPAGHVVRAKQPELVLRENRERPGRRA
jgi:serine O-acetyltransferase